MFDQDAATAAIKRWLANVRRQWWVVVLIVVVTLVATFWSEKTKINLWASKINPQTLEFYKAIGTVLVAVIAAAIAGGIQYRQWKTAHRQWETAQQKLNVELLQPRLTIYKATSELTRTIMTTGKAVDAISKFHTDTIDAEWLFDEEIAKYLRDEYMPMAVHHSNAVYAQQRPVAPNDFKGIQKAADEFTEWHTHDFKRRKALFAPFLRVDYVDPDKKKLGIPKPRIKIMTIP